MMRKGFAPIGDILRRILCSSESWGRAATCGAALLAILVMSACDSRSERAAAAEARFAEAFSAGDYAGARLAISEALSARDDVPAFWIHLARTEAALEQYERAFAAYQRALELDPNNLEAMQNMAELQVLQEDFAQAERTADRILQVSPGDPRAELVRGYIALGRRQNPAALATAERVLERYPADESALLLRARALDQLGHREEGIALLERSIRVAGPRQPTLGALREFYEADGDWPGLARTFARLLELSPNDNNLRLEFARAAFSNGDHGRGNAQAARILGSRSDNLGLLEDTADLLLANANVSLDSATLERLGQNASPTARLAIARVAIEKGFAPLGSRLLEPLLVGPMTTVKATAVGLQALNRLKQGDVANARRLADAALDFDETNMTALLVRARAALAQGRLDDALAAAQLLAREDPSRHGRLLGQVHRARGNDALARAFEREARPARVK